MKRGFPMLAVALSLVLALGACGGQKDTGFNNLPKASGTGGGGGGTKEIKLVSGNRFEPKTFQAKVGEVVTWMNMDPSQPHNVVSDTDLFDSNPDCLKDQSKCMDPNEKFTFTFKEAGTYPYYCAIHGAKGGIGMAGVIEVA